MGQGGEHWLLAMAARNGQCIVELSMAATARDVWMRSKEGRQKVGAAARCGEHRALRESIPGVACMQP